MSNTTSKSELNVFQVSACTPFASYEFLSAAQVTSHSCWDNLQIHTYDKFCDLIRSLELKPSISMHPLGRIGQPEEVARAIAYLLHPDSSWTTGQVLGVDGGLARLKGR